MTHKRSRIILIAVLILLLGGGIAGYVGVRFVAHERAQNESISDLTAKVALLSERLNSNEAGNEFVASVTDDGYDYLALGNSITIHPVNDYWFGEWGMAASTEENDYFHRVVNGLSGLNQTQADESVVDNLGDLQTQSTQTYGSVEGAERDNHINAFAYNYYTWEVNAHDRAETFSLIDDYLVPGVDLVTLQLSENASDLTTFEADYVELVNHIKERCPDVQIVIIDDFWSSEKSGIKKAVAEETGVSFADLSDIRGQSDYQLGMNAIVYDAEGQEHVNKHDGVSKHPGDEGMEVIAERVLEKVSK